MSDTPPAPVLDVSGLTKGFGGRSVVDDLAFTVDAGEVVALVGPNGSGKTTVLRCVVGVEPPDRGTVLLAGDPLEETDPRVRHRVCSLLDDVGWFSDVSASEHLDLVARTHDDPDPQDKVDAALELLGIADVADQVPLTLSSGQRRRLGLATTLVRPYDLLVLDEPEQRLDTAGRRWLAEHLAALARDGKAVLLACHDDELLDAVGARRVRLGP